MLNTHHCQALPMGSGGLAASKMNFLLRAATLFVNESMLSRGTCEEAR